MEHRFTKSAAEDYQYWLKVDSKKLKELSCLSQISSKTTRAALASLSRCVIKNRDCGHAGLIANIGWFIR